MRPGLASKDPSQPLTEWHTRTAMYRDTRLRNRINHRVSAYNLQERAKLVVHTRVYKKTFLFPQQMIVNRWQSFQHRLQTVAIEVISAERYDVGVAIAVISAERYNVQVAIAVISAERYNVQVAIAVISAERYNVQVAIAVISAERYNVQVAIAVVSAERYDVRVLERCVLQ
ncbi:hypothetical protein Btru_067979 [Bulinus truncatus]|nr:hypothetical protein Btru_067979 [Bulinus truncatus]